MTSIFAQSHETGLLQRLTPHAELYHHEFKRRGAEDTPENRAFSTRNGLYVEDLDPNWRTIRFKRKFFVKRW